MIDFDVIVAGGGNAGLCAALTAREHGARVLLIERSPRWRRGGNSRHTRDIRYAHAQPDPWAAEAYPIEAFLHDIESVAAPTRPDLAELMVRDSEELPEWMEYHGVRWQGPITGTLHLHTNRFFLGGGKAMVNAYYASASHAGVDIVYEASVVGLEFDGSVCRSVEFDHEGRRTRARTSAVVVSSGGLEANHAWLAESWGDGANNFIVRGTPHNDGALVLDLLEHGASQTGSTAFHCIGVDARSPRFDGGIVTRVDSIPFSVVLNRHGRRFYDEGEDAWPMRYAQWGQLIAQQPEQLVYSIFDAQTWGLFIPSVYPPLSSDSLDGLLAMLDLDQGEAARTIAAFNEAIDDTAPFNPSLLDGRAAIDLDPPRRNWACRIEQPPFFAYPLRPGLTFTYAGLEVDRTARVVRRGYGSFANVFAAGESMAGNILSKGYLAGVGLTIGAVFGRIAGREAAGVAGV